MQPGIELSRLEGKWHVVQSNFGMWLNGDKTKPAFNYTIAKKYGVTGLADEVSYLQKGKQKFIRGFDIPVNNLNTSFIWRSSFLFGLIKSRWQILHIDESFQWAIIRFSKTLFTKAGEDVIVRDEHVCKNVQHNINNQLRKLEITGLKQL